MRGAEQDDAAQREDEQFALYMAQHFGLKVPGAADTAGSVGESDEDVMVSRYVAQHFPSGALEW